MVPQYPGNIYTPFVPLVTAFHQSNKGNLDDLESWGFAHQRLTSSRKFLRWRSARRLALEKQQSLSSFLCLQIQQWLFTEFCGQICLIKDFIHWFIIRNKNFTIPTYQSTKKVEIAIFNLDEMKEMPTMAHITLSDVTGNDIFLADWIFKEYKIKI